MKLRCLIVSLAFLTPSFMVKGLAQSVLKQEHVIKIATTTAGVHKIDAVLLREAGFDPAAVSPHNIQVYGMPGGMIPQRNDIPYPTSPQAVAMMKQANSNDTFEDDEYILFYADDVDDFSFDKETKTYNYAKNIYADSLYYFISTTHNSPQQLVTASTKTSVNSSVAINWHENFYVHESELVNISNSGRQWFGESFLTNKSQSFEFNLENPLASNQQLVLLNGYLGQVQNTEETIDLSVNNFVLSSERIKPLSEIFFPLGYPPFGSYVTSVGEISNTLLGTTNKLTVGVNHKQADGGRSTGYLDYIFLQVPEKNELGNKQLILRNKLYQPIASFKVSVANIGTSLVWDITNSLKPDRINHNAGNFNYQNNQTKDEVKFVVFNLSNTLRPAVVKKLTASSLSKITAPDFLIIAHPAFMSSAIKLANHRSAHSGMSVNVAGLDEVINEYGAGRKDVSAIRNFIKDLYRKNPGKLKYVLLMGAGSYDFKDRVNNNTNFVPIYQSRNSIDPLSTYASDDFYAFMDDDEGFWSEDISNNDDMDLGVGRIPCRTVAEAENIVNKIIRYDAAPALLGKWRNELYFVADDEDNAFGTGVNQFYEQSEELIDYVIDGFDYFNINKLFMGGFEQEVFASTQRSPAMRNALDKMMQKGALVVNYIGHGAEESWTDEAVLTNSMIEKWSNSDHFPLFVTATCEFGRHDNPIVVSGAQKLLLKKDAGAIGLLTTARPVFSTSNLKLNKAFYANSFKRINGQPQKLGDIIKETKNGSVDGINNRNFVLLGDPSMTLGLPKEAVVIDGIYNESGLTDTLRSLEKVTISGHVESRAGQLLTNFEGEVVAELFDKPVVKKTLENGSNQFSYQTYESVLYRGRGTVSAGEFDLTFYLPKEINYKNGLGKLSLYAFERNKLTDANGFRTDFSIGGSISTDFTDDISPDLFVYLNDSTFNSGDKVGANNELFIRLFDEYGIGISQNGLNNGVFYQLDNDEKVKVNDFFIYDIDSYQNGRVKVNLPELDEGWHQLHVGAVDIFSNPSEAFIDFYVVNSDQLSILEFIVYPNPAKEAVNLQFKHNRKAEELEVFYEVTDGFGRKVFSDRFTTSDNNRKDFWDLRAGGGEKSTPGLYFITLSIRSELDNSKTREIKKLIVIN